MADDPDPIVSSWPITTSEQRAWRSTQHLDWASNAARRRHTGPYQAAVVPEIADLDLRLPTAVFALADEASVAIARFDAEMGADMAPFGAILLRSESASSSEIEQLSSGARAIAVAELGERSNRNAGLIVANVRAMQAAIDLADRLDEAAVIAMHEALLGESTPDQVGAWRDEQVWIGGGSYGPHGATFVPPHHERVPAAMTDLVRFVRRDDVPALAHAAVAHAQFETVHPFTDGNGRTGRALVHSMLRTRGLTRNVTVPVSAGLLTDVAAYFAALEGYRAGRPEMLVELMAEAAFQAIGNGRALVAELSEVLATWTTTISARSDSAVWPLTRLLLRQPVVNVGIVCRELGVTDMAAYRAIEQLAAASVLRPLDGRSRNQMWQAKHVLTAVDAFAQRAGRRGSDRH